MAINRFNLIAAIFKARKSKNDEVHDELLRIYYRLLEQEEINDDFIVDFVTNTEVSESAKKTLSECLLTVHSQY